MLLRYFFFLVSTSTCSFGFKSFQNKIPNGDAVPHPCKSNFLWHGVGHLNELGGGSRNKFGKDFAAAGLKWTEDLCKKDSDEDGRTNGEELGDPNCTWKEGSSPEKDRGLSHPGVCEPYDSDLCHPKNSWLNCELESFKCDAIKSPDVKNLTIRFPKTAVPSLETNYFCMTFDLPIETDGNYHIIATTPVIDNENIMHHTLLYGCDSEKQEMISQPEECQMGLSSCSILFGAWTVGSTGQCSNKESGFRIGVKGFTRVMMQMHWNNPEKRADYTDSSGMTLYYTPNLRPNDAAMLMVGQIYLAIPPGSKRYTASSICDAEDTRELFKGPIKVTRAMNHMHYLGREQYMEVLRDGVSVASITNESTYSYDRPISFSLPNTIQIQPGDEIKTTCVFKSTNKRKTTFMGRGTNEEMCFGFLEVYPSDNLGSRACTNWRSLSMTRLYSRKDPYPYACKAGDFLNVTHPQTAPLFQKLREHCQPLSICLEECKEVVKEVRKHPCMEGDMGEYTRNVAARRFGGVDIPLFMSMIQSCDLDLLEEKLLIQMVKDSGNSASSIFQMRYYELISLFLFVSYMLLF